MSRPAPGEGMEGWVGRRQVAEAVLDPWPVAALAAALDRDDPPGPGEELPPFWHQLYARPTVRASETGPDGHERLGAGFLPALPLPLPRRMWAGGRLAVHRAPRIGERVRRTSTVRAVTPKEGRQGPLVFVMVEHRFEAADGGGGAGGGLLLVEEQDLVYRAPAPLREAAGGAPARAGAWRRRWAPDPVLLFRYSALTYNGHRIHYDLAHAREVEGYRGLVVHGPLLATLMLDLVRRELPGRPVRRFAFRARAPLAAGEDLVVHGEPASEGSDRIALWVAGPDERLAMEGEAEVGGT